MLARDHRVNFIHEATKGSDCICDRREESSAFNVCTIK